MASTQAKVHRVEANKEEYKNKSLNQPTDILC